MYLNKELFGNETSRAVSIGGYPLKEDDILSPCGLIARAIFTDRFELYSAKDPKNLRRIPINETGIANDIDKTKVYKKGPDAEKKQWIDVEDEHFMVWMNMETFHNFQKLWGRIDEELEVGVYYLYVHYNWESIKQGVKKTFMLASAQFLGSASFFGWALVKAGGILALVIFIMIILKSSQKTTFSEQDLHW